MATKNPYYSGPPSDHFDGARFFVPGVTRDKSRADMWKWMRSRQRMAWPARVPVTPARPEPRITGERLVVTAIGHASFLIQTAGLNILLDPVFSRRASPFRFAGPRRVTAPGVARPDLPALDAVLLTHNHYDHMDVATLHWLARHRPAPVLTPLGNGRLLRRCDVRELDWWASAAIGPVRVHCVPAYHWSARGLKDRRMALWGGFVIEAPGGPIYAVGDSGWHGGALFREIAARFPGIRLALIPIGAYAPRWFMGDQHVDPDQAVALFRACGARQALAKHWGTFQLTDEAIDEPPRLLAKALEKAGTDPALFAVRRPGEVLELDP